MLELPKKTYGGYIFDCDGTLADTMPAHYKAWRTAFIEHGAKFDFTWELFYSYAGTGLRDSVVLLNKQFDDTLDPDAVIATQSELCDGFLNRIGPIQPVVDFVHTVVGKAAISVASGGSREHVHKTLRVISLFDLFPVIVTKDDIVNGKPAPDTFLKAAELMGVAPEECLVFEDSMLGIEAAKRANMDYVYVDPKLSVGLEANFSI